MNQANDFVADEVAQMFELIEEPQRTKCKFVYLHAKIETMQNNGNEPSDELMDAYTNLEEQLKNRGYSTNHLLYDNE